jgi:hypothetical protein
MESLAVIKMVAEDRPHFVALRDRLLGTLKLLAAVVMPLPAPRAETAEENVQ